MHLIPELLTQRKGICPLAVYRSVLKGKCDCFTVVAYLGSVDNDFAHSSVCLVLLGQMGIGQNMLFNWARW